MLIVKDFDKLEGYGFTKQPWKNGRGADIWYKDIKVLGEGEEIQLSLIVNPCGTEYVTGQLICNVQCEAEKMFEAEFQIDTVFELIAAGVVEIMKTNGKQVA